jgi:polyvinyl alcohol dehydrogenase (cytochrome)
MLSSAAMRIILALAFLAAAATPVLAQDGGALYKSACAFCHDAGVPRAPNAEALRAMTPQRILASMETGPMIAMVHNRTVAERRAIAEFASGKKFGVEFDRTPAPKAMCTASVKPPADPTAGPAWSGWGRDAVNTRFQDAQTAGLTAADVPKLKVKWAFAFPGEVMSTGAATVTGGRLFVGSVAGRVYALNAATGCIHWYFDAEGGVRSAISVARLDGTPVRYAAFFGDNRANAYAVDATTGTLIWKTKVDEFTGARVTGSPVYHRGRLFVPMASGEEGSGSSPTYECCKFRGSLTALDATTGKPIWKTYMVEEPTQRGKNRRGTQLWGPSGAPIWSSPAIDEAKNAIYVTTGNNYSDPPSSMSDAFVAMDRETGKILWSRQATAMDAYVSACRLADKTNCPDSNGPDFDFSASPSLVTLANGRRVLAAGHKSGIVYAVDPDNNGEVLWATRVGQGGTMGGVQWGQAVDGRTVYVANSDIGRLMLTYTTFTDADPKRGGGMFALDLATGKQLWQAPPSTCGNRPRCSPAQSGAVSAIPGVAFSGSVDGHLRAYEAASGKVVWDFDTVREYESVNGVEAWGGSLDGAGPAIAGGVVYAASGYTLGGGMSGNVLIAFSVDGK